MRYIAAYLLLNLAGNDNPTAADITKVLSSAGVEADEERVNTLVSELEGKSAEELIAQGKEKLASVPAGGAAAAGGSSAAAAGGEAAAAEEKEEEEEEESDDDMGFGLFD
ncbi:60S acidic ribosomal protein P2 [Dispira simplex]|nr:60S acidic ribosomal protein P2 [Dispira simplex]